MLAMERQVALRDMQVGAADPASGDPQSNLPGAGHRFVALDEPQRFGCRYRPLRVYLPGPHGFRMASHRGVIAAAPLGTFDTVPTGSPRRMLAPRRAAGWPR